MKFRSPAGFTLIELLVVTTLIVILAGTGLAMYSTSVTRAREATLKEDLFRMRSVSRRQGHISTCSRFARQRWIPAQGARGSVHPVFRELGTRAC
jgi:prepilin-type N-terminal cleavage/methylation domain-containing protein